MVAKKAKSASKTSHKHESPERKDHEEKSHDHKKHEEPTHHSEDHNKNEEELIQEGLQAIYGEEEMDFSKLERSGSRISSILLTVVITLAIVAGAAWAGFFVYMKFFTNQNQELFDLKIQMDENLKSGEKTSIEVDYVNTAGVQLAALELDLRLPDSFQITKMEPLPDDFDELIWDIGNIPTGSDGVILIEGIWITEVPSSTPVQVFSSFHPSNFNSDFQEIETKYISTTESVLETSIEGPDEIQPGESGDYTITVKQTGDEIFESATVKLELPNGFYLDSSDPAIETGLAPMWEFENLSKEEDVIITFSGIFAADIEGFQYFNVQTSIVEDGKTYIQNNEQGFTDLLQTDLSLSMVANGAINDAVVGMGDDLRVTLALENESNQIVSNAFLLLDFQSASSIPIDWKAANLDGGTITQEGIYWSASKFGELAPTEKRTLNLTFPIKDTITASQSDEFTLAASATIGSSIVRSSPVAVSIATDASFEAIAKYFSDSGTPLGLGPLPPKAGETTTYRIYWQINNSLHDLDAISVTASLPPNVKWAGDTSTDLGGVRYNESENEIEWTISNLPSSLPVVGANFAIELTPDSGDVGKFAKLLSSSTFKATDASTRATLQNTIGSLTTDLEFDSYADGKGVVIE